MNGWLFNLHLKRFERGSIRWERDLRSKAMMVLTSGCISPAEGGECVCYKPTQRDNVCALVLTVNFRWFKHDGPGSRAAVEPRLLSQYERTEGGDEILMRWLFYTVCCPVLSCSPVTSQHETLVYRPLTLDVHWRGCELWSKICGRQTFVGNLFLKSLAVCEVQVLTCKDVNKGVVPLCFV